MKKHAFIAVVTALLSLSAFADTLGIPDGGYKGVGVLESKSMLVPDLKFKSLRLLSDGTIMARTQAFLMGHAVATAEAKLLFKPAFGPEIKVLDLNNQLAVVGKGACDDRECTFTATVMKGQLTLTETWVRDGDGFKVINGSQNFKGLESTYTGDFSPLP